MQIVCRAKVFNRRDFDLHYIALIHKRCTENFRSESNYRCINLDTISVLQ